MLNEENNEEKNKLADDVVDLMVDYEIKRLMQFNNGWICGFGMDERIENSKRKFRHFSLKELKFLGDLYKNNAERDILNKYSFTKLEAFEVFKKAKANMPLIFYHRYLA